MGGGEERQVCGRPGAALGFRLSAVSLALKVTLRDPAFRLDRDTCGPREGAISHMAVYARGEPRRKGARPEHSTPLDYFGPI